MEYEKFEFGNDIEESIYISLRLYIHAVSRYVALVTCITESSEAHAFFILAYFKA